MLIWLLGGLLMTGCGNSRAAAEPLVKTRMLLDTVCSVTVYKHADENAQAEALDLCAAYDALFSRTAEGSDIWRVNHAGGAAREVDPATADLVSLGLEYGAFSGGQFDISIGRLSALWDFGNSNVVPDQALLQEARATVDYRQVVVSENTVRLADPQAWLDLGGIAKGYIADQMAALLKERGVKSALIDLGGNIVTVGLKPGGNQWGIGVRQPFGGRAELAGLLRVGESSVVTSGIYERCFTENGQFYHHILDPKSGYPAESDIAGATMITENSAQGDALATVFLMAGSAKAPELLAQSPGLQGVVLVLKSGEVQTYGDIDFQPAHDSGAAN